MEHQELVTRVDEHLRLYGLLLDEGITAQLFRQCRAALTAPAQAMSSDERTLADRLESYVPDGDGHHTEYAGDLMRAAALLRQLPGPGVELLDKVRRTVLGSCKCEDPEDAFAWSMGVEAAFDAIEVARGSGQ